MESEGAPPEGALIGRTIGGRFTITEFLTEGGMGAIYRGTESGHAMFHDVSGLGGALHRTSNPPSSSSRPAGDRGPTPPAEHSPWEVPVGASTLAAVGVGALVLAILAALLR